MEADVILDLILNKHLKMVRSFISDCLKHRFITDVLRLWIVKRSGGCL